MKIALLGPQKSGKTVYFSGLSYRFRDNISFIPLSPKQILEYEQIGVARRVGLHIEIGSSRLDRTLTDNMGLLAELPDGDWPSPTEDLEQSSISCNFKFCDINMPGLTDIDVHCRDIELFDPAGDAISGKHIDSDVIVKKLGTCDAVIVFLDSKQVIENLEYNDINKLRFRLNLGKISQIINDTAKNIPREEILPVCFVLSKFDLVTNLNETLIKQFEVCVYDMILKPFSVENTNIMLCVCPTSVIDAESGRFRAHNLEWPFLFAAGGTIFRNSLALRDKADDSWERARHAEASADELANSGWWTRMWKYLDGDGVKVRRQRAAYFRNDHGRLVTSADDDLEFSKNIWKSLAIEGSARGVRIYRGGKMCDPLEVAAQLGEKA